MRLNNPEQSISKPAEKIIDLICNEKEFELNALLNALLPTRYLESHNQKLLEHAYLLMLRGRHFNKLNVLEKILTENSLPIKRLIRSRPDFVFLMIEKANISGLDYLFKKGFSIAFRNNSSETPLMVACRLACQNNRDMNSIAINLLDKGADPNGSYEDGGNPLWLSLQSGNRELFQALSKNGAILPCKKECDGSFKETELHFQARTQHTDYTYWISRGAVKESFFGYIPTTTPYPVATYLNLVSQYLDYGGNANIRNSNEETLLHIACKTYNWNLFSELLLFESIDINAQDKAGNTPLHVLCNELQFSTLLSRQHNVRGSLLSMIKALYQSNKTNPNLQNRLGLNPLQIICNQSPIDLDVLSIMLTSGKTNGLNKATWGARNLSPIHLVLQQINYSRITKNVIGALGLLMGRPDLNLNVIKYPLTSIHPNNQTAMEIIRKHETLNQMYQCSCHFLDPQEQPPRVFSTKTKVIDTNTKKNALAEPMNGTPASTQGLMPHYKQTCEKQRSPNGANECGSQDPLYAEGSGFSKRRKLG